MDKEEVKEVDEEDQGTDVTTVLQYYSILRITPWLLSTELGSSLKGAQRTEMEDDYSFSTALM